MADAAQAAKPSGWRRPYLRQTALPGPTSVATEGSGAAGADMVITHAPLSVPQTVSSIAGKRSSPFLSPEESMSSRRVFQKSLPEESFRRVFQKSPPSRRVFQKSLLRHLKSSASGQRRTGICG